MPGVEGWRSRNPFVWGSLFVLRHAGSVAVLGALVFAAGCGGGGGSAAVPSGSPSATQQMGTVTFTLAIPGRTPGKKGKLPLYISSAVTSATIVYTPAGGGSPGTVHASCTTNCAATFSAPAGVDRFDITLLDASNAALSQGSTTSVVTAGGSNPISMTFNGIVHDATLRIAPASLPAGTAATAFMFVDAHDADGATIVPDGTYVDAGGAPVLFTIANATTGGPISVSSSGVTAPGTVLPVTYSGAATLGTTFTLTTASSLPGAVTGATLSVLPSTVYTYPYQIGAQYGHNIVADGSGHAYAYADDFPIQIGSTARVARAAGRIPAGARRTASGPSPGNGYLFACCDGNRSSVMTTSNGIADIAYAPFNGGTVFIDDGAALLGFQLGGGSSTVALPGSSEAVQRLAAGADGNLYYTALDNTATGYVGYADDALTTVTQIQLASPNASPLGITFAHDGNAYFAESGDANIGVLTPAGANPAAVTELALPNANDVPLEIVDSPLQNAVFALGYSNGDPNQGTVWKIGYPQHNVKVYRVTMPAQTCGCGFYRLHTTTDYSLWTIDLENGELVRIDLPTKGVVEFPVQATTNVFAEDFAFMPDGSIVYVGANINGVGKLIW